MNIFKREMIKSKSAIFFRHTEATAADSRAVSKTVNLQLFSNSSPCEKMQLPNFN